MFRPRTRRFFKSFLLALVVLLFLFNHFPKASIEKDTDSDMPASSSAPIFPQGRRHPRKSPQTLLEEPVAVATTPRPVLGKHRFRPDGLVEVNEDGAHPIYELISRAEREWEDKLKRASKTLGEAVDEYRRRYNRRPPKGFDLW
jgi:hypothetical protein